MARKMEFWNEIRELQLLDVKIGVIVANSSEMVDRPFASDVVRYDDVADGKTSQHGRDDIVRIDIPTQ
jgi:hypothetical protein